MNFVFTHRAGAFTGFVDVPSLVLLGIAPPCVMMLSHSISDLFAGIGILLQASFRKQANIEKEVINTLSMASQLVRTDGMGVLMQLKNRVRYPLLRDGFSLIVNDFSVDEIRHNLQAKIEAKQTHMLTASSLFENMSKVCPAMGMVGTLIGLARMLSDMKDPASIGGGMAMAIIGTLYGLMLGTVVYAPFGEKIALESEKTLEIDRMVMEGVLLLKGKKSSVHLRDVVSTYSKARIPAGARR